MNGVIAGGVTNIVLDYIFLYPMNMGMKGAALATVLGSSLTVVILCTHFFTKKNLLKFTLKGFHPSFLQKIIANGFTSFVIEAASGFTIFIFNLQLIRYLGNTGVSVYGIICNTALVVICLCKGIEQLLSRSCRSTTEQAFKPDLKGTVTFIKNICDHLYPASPLGLFVPNLFTYIFWNQRANPDSGSSGHPDLFYRIFVSGHQHGLYLLFSVRSKIRSVSFTLPVKRMYSGGGICLYSSGILWKYRNLAGISRR